MEKLDPRTDGATPDIVEENVEELKRLFPEVVTEGKLDFDALREVLGDYMDEREERYSFTWNGKSRARRLAQTPSAGTLRPCPEESVNWDTTQNLFIEGENLEVLKLLQKSYHRKIKMVYIDPPYNTGGDFMYPDDFRNTIATYLELTGQIDDSNRKLSANPETSGRYHTDWLNMMYPRLRLARNLLRDDGVIFVSIDDHEVHNLRRVCDEVFGEENLLACIAWEKRSSPDARSTIGSVHDWILCYVRSSEDPKAAVGKMPLTEERRAAYKNPDNDPRGPWASVDMTGMLGRATNDQFFDVTLPSGRTIGPPEGRSWGLAPATFEKLREDNRIWFGVSGDNVPRIKSFLSESEGQVVPSLWKMDAVGSNDEASKELADLFGVPKVFDTPKPTRLLERMLQISTKAEDDLVLDFFAGSCSAAHALLRLNQKDGGARRFIMVQLPEPCDPDSEAARAGYSNIAEIGKERIRRAIGALEQAAASEAENAQQSLLDDEGEGAVCDCGFRVLKLDLSNIKAWDAEFEDVEGALLSSVENVKPDRSEADVLYELLLKFGLDLAIPMEQREIAGATVHIVGAGALIVCLAEGIGIEVVEGVAALKNELAPETIRVVFKDAGFADDVVKTNAVQILHQAGIKDVRSL